MAARYEVSIPRAGCAGPADAIRKARRVARFEHVSVAGHPEVQVERLVPLIGPARAYRVTFPIATRTRRR